jgi:hypothetical protein
MAMKRREFITLFGAAAGRWLLGAAEDRLKQIGVLLGVAEINF